MLSEALAAAMRCALASGCDAAFNLMLWDTERPSSPAASARAALGAHMHSVMCTAARCGARGALQALLVCLPEHTDALDSLVLDAACQAGQAATACDVELLLCIRNQSTVYGQDAFCTVTTAAAAAPLPEVSTPQKQRHIAGGDAFSAGACASPGLARTSADIDVYVGSCAASCSTPKMQHPAAAARRAAGAGGHKRAGAGAGPGGALLLPLPQAAAGGSFSSVPSSADASSSDGCYSRAGSSSADSDYEFGLLGEFDIGAAAQCCTPRGAPRVAKARAAVAAAVADVFRVKDCGAAPAYLSAADRSPGPCHPYMTAHQGAGAAASGGRCSAAAAGAGAGAEGAGRGGGPLPGVFARGFGGSRPGSARVA